MKSFIFALMALTIAPSLAMAGESNSKDDPRLTVRNRGNAEALVVIDGNLSDFSQALNPALTDLQRLEAFRGAGGVVLGPRDDTSAEVKAGTHTVAYFFLDGDLPEFASDFIIRDVRVREGIDANVRIQN